MTLSGTGVSIADVTDCFRLEPLTRFDEPSSDVEESFEARESRDPWCEIPGRCEVR